MYKSVEDLQANLHVFVVLLKFQLFAFFAKKQETVYSNASQKINVYWKKSYSYSSLYSTELSE